MKSEKIQFFFIAMGLLLTMMGVGGVENSLTDTELLQSVAVSVLGLGFMWVAVLAIRSSENG